MVDAFKVPEGDAIRVAEGSLRTSTAALIAKMGVPLVDAELAADVLVTADLRGVDSHGVSNELRVYLQRYADGTQNARPQWKVLRERPATATIDADKGLGVIVALWWTYFDVNALAAERRLASISGADRAEVARDAYSYLHLPMTIGVVFSVSGSR